MTTPSDSEENKTNESKAASSRTRSPAYPFISLAAAIEKAKVIWETEKRNAASVETLAADWGLKPKSSTGQLYAASLKKYGLLRESEEGKGRGMKLTEAALNLILNDQVDSPEHLNLLKQCALSPKIHAELWKKYNGELPSDTNLKRHLIVDKNFNSAAVDGFIKNFRDTILFAKLSPSDKITVVDGKDDDPEDEQSQSSQQPVVDLQQTTKPMITQTQPTTFVSSGTIVVREVSLPLSTGVATFRIPAPITQEDFKNMEKALNIFRDGLVSFPSVDCLKPDYEGQAAAFADSQTEFNLINFSYSHDIEFCKKLAVEHGFNLRFDPNKGLAFFRIREDQ